MKKEKFKSVRVYKDNIVNPYSYLRVLSFGLNITESKIKRIHCSSYLRPSDPDLTTEATRWFSRRRKTQTDGSDWNTEHRSTSSGRPMFCGYWISYTRVKVGLFFLFRFPFLERDQLKRRNIY